MGSSATSLPSMGGTQRVFSFGVFDLTGEWKALREIT